MPANQRGECRACGQGIAYHGRRDLLEAIASWRRELDAALRAGSSRLGDAACAVLQAARTIELSAQGYCASYACETARTTSSSSPAETTKQLPLIPE